LRPAIAAGLLALLPIPARAQALDGPDNFGTQDQAITIIGFEEFFPTSSGAAYASDNNDGSRWVTGGAVAGLVAPINMLPNGSLLEQAVFYVSDDAPNDNVRALLCRNWVDSASGDNPGQDCPIILTTSGMPGDTYLEDFPDLPILYRQDVDGDGTTEVVHYRLAVETPPSNGLTRLRMARLRWRRQVPLRLSPLSTTCRRTIRPSSSSKRSSPRGPPSAAAAALLPRRSSDPPPDGGLPVQGAGPPLAVGRAMSVQT
jgi:hypothetical protein